VIRADTILSHEIIGLDVQILDSTQTSRNISGNIIGETKNTIFVRTYRGTKIVPKKSAATIKFSLESGACFISGSSLIGRPEDRISRNR
jgi:ribonuclease P protein subunit POP4